MQHADLIFFFISTFQVSTIYDLGWNAAREWMLLITGVLTAIAIALRLLEERVVAIANQQTNWTKVATNVFLVALAIVLYFVLADLVIQFFNAIYKNIGNNGMGQMAAILDSLTTKLFNLDIQVGWGIVFDSFYFIGASLLYLFTYLILVFVIFASKVAHAVLVSFAIFWGAVALPLSITNGFKSLTAWRNIVLLCLIWPIVDAFLMYLVSGAFLHSLGSEFTDLRNMEEIELGQIVFYLMLFSIMNMFLTAVAFSAPLVSQGLANGSGNATSLIGGFATAGMAAGASIASLSSRGFNAAAPHVGGFMKGKDISEGGMGVKAMGQGLSSMASQMMGKENTTPNNAMSSSEAKGSTSPLSNTHNSQANTSGIGDSLKSSINAMSQDSSLHSDESIATETSSSAPQPESNMADETDKRKAQAKRAAIIQHNKGK